MEANNNQKMREAIAKCVNLITEFGNAEIIETPLDVIIEIEAILKAALSAPARNCDVGTAEEQYQRYEKLCCSHYSITDNGDGNCLKCPFSEPTCKFAWAQMPYEEGGAE